jgi:hypothetical protein
MTDPHTSMSLAATLVLTVVALVLLVGWLAAVLLAAREPGRGSARPGSEDPARAGRAEAVTRRGEMPAGAHAAPPDGQPAAGGGTGKPAAGDAGPAG